jgi:probable HAF family extracellular repeat protein
MTDLGTLGGDYSSGNAINARGQVTGTADLAGNVHHAFLYSGGQMTDLGTLGGDYSSGNAINARGQVTGTAHRIQARVEVDPDNPGNHVLHVVATGPTEHMHNHVETTYIGNRPITNGLTYQVSFRAKWLGGVTLLNTRLYFNRIHQTSVLPIPALNGTPGTQNSRYETNIGPTFAHLQNQPVRKVLLEEGADLLAEGGCCADVG